MKKFKKLFSVLLTFVMVLTLGLSNVAIANAEEPTANEQIVTVSFILQDGTTFSNGATQVSTNVDISTITQTYFTTTVIGEIDPVNGADFIRKYNDQPTALDIIKIAADQITADGTNTLTANMHFGLYFGDDTKPETDPDGIYFDTAFGKDTINNYSNFDDDGNPHKWTGKYWNISVSGTEAAYYANNILASNVTSINLTYVEDSMTW